jgi:hypothetical protein
MDSAAFHELISQVRGAAAALAEAERKVAAFRAELTQQEHAARLEISPTRRKAIPPVARRVSSGWVPAG